MSDINLETINLNLVPVLRALLRERSVSAAAASLGRSPSAVSETLSQLREVLEDPLLIRVGGRLQLTPKAASLMDPLEALHGQLLAFFRSDHFDPATSTRAFTIASSDLLIYEFGPAMVRSIRRSAPHMTIHFVDVARGLTEKMASREIDFVLLPDFAVDDLAPAPIRFKGLTDSKYKLLVGCGHPLAKRVSVDAEELSRYRRVAFLPDSVLLEGRKKQSPGEVLYGGERDVSAVTVSQFLTIPYLLEGTDLIAVVPSNIANAAACCASVIAIDLANNPYRCRFGIAWSPIFDCDDAHRWFRGCVLDKAAQLPVTPGNCGVSRTALLQDSLSQ